MASIFKRKDGFYYLREKIDGKVKLTYLGTKPPLPKGISRNLMTLRMFDGDGRPIFPLECVGCQHPHGPCIYCEHFEARQVAERAAMELRKV